MSEHKTLHEVKLGKGNRIDRVMDPGVVKQDPTLGKKIESGSNLKENPDPTSYNFN